MYEADYRYFDKLLHKWALSNSFLAAATFDIDQLMHRIDAELDISRSHVFISGLARAGTTLLLRQLHDSGEFRSLSYRDMPFPLMPILWSKLSRSHSKRLISRERAHGDGIIVNADSPESIEEVFWRVFAGRTYLRKDRLISMPYSAELVEKFRQYVAAVIQSPHTEARPRYLSKNNNNILRLDTIRSAFPNALIIIPFRTPLNHAASLLQQHRHFSALQKNTSFARHYMEWLGHYEFGEQHRPFILNEQMVGELQSLTPDSLDYWLALWNGVYSHLLQSPHSKGAYFLSYERYCAEHHHIWPKIAELSGISVRYEFSDVVRAAQDHHIASSAVSSERLRESERIYQQLLSHEQSSFGSPLRQFS